MRVLVSTSTFPLRPDDGLPRFVLDLSLALAEHCEVSVLAPGAPGVPAHERWGELRIERFAYFLPRAWQRLAYRGGMPDNLAASWAARFQVAPFLAAQVRATRRLVRERRIDVVHSHWILPQGLASALARPAGFRHVVTLHGGDAHLLRRLPLAGRVARFVEARSDAFFAVSSQVKHSLEAALGHPSAAEVLPMGVHLARFREGPAQPPQELPFADGYLLFVGRLAPIKGVDFLLRALPRVRRRLPQLGLVLVGDGPCQAALREQAGSLGILSAVHFAGPAPHAEVARWLRGCRAAVVPSVQGPDGRVEGMPAVVLEALAAGARVVATRTGGIGDVLRDGENGWLCGDRDPEALADGILRALDAGPAAELRRRALASAAPFDWGRVAQRYLACFSRTTGG